MAAQKLVLLGTGFGGFSLLRDIDTHAYEVTVVSARNHFLFTPLLPSTTVGTLEFRSIIEPVRHAGRSVAFFQAHCHAIDAANCSAQCTNVLDAYSFAVPYDKLVIAVGAVNNTYRIPGVEEHALFLRELADARAIRQAIVGCFERAGVPSLPSEERRRLLHFVVVGGGPTGVEFSAELHDFLVEDLRQAYPRLVDQARITLLEAADHILNTFDDELSSYTQRYFGRQRIDVRTRSLVSRIEKSRAFLNDGTSIEFGLLVWSAGIGPTPLVQSLPFKKDAASKIVVDNCLRVVGANGIYALGDCAAIEGIALPATAQVAQQEGKYLAKALNRLARQKEVEPFEYKNLGMLAYIGGRRALADLSSFKGRGFLAWMFWRSAYLTRLVSMKNKILVLFDWTKTLLFGRDVSSL